MHAARLGAGTAAVIAVLGLSGCAFNPLSTFTTPTIDQIEHETVTPTVSDDALVTPGTLTVALDTSDAPQAMQDADGFYFLVDRKKDVIISGGENLYPVQIEDFLSAYPKIHDVAVIGLPDKRLGEIAAAIIQVKDGMTCTESEINQFCTDLPRYKRPRKIIFADVPRNPTGKIEKPKLREKYCGVRLVEAQNQA